MAERLKKTAIIFESLPKTTTFAPLSPESTFFEQYLENVSHLRKYLIRFPYARRQWSHKPRAKRSLLIFAEAPETFAADKFSRKFICGNSSVGRARPCQGRGREFESRLPLKSRSLIYFGNAQVAELVDAHVSGACAARCAGSSPVLGTSLERWRNW